jgi:hypothetical protein
MLAHERLVFVCGERRTRVFLWPGRGREDLVADADVPPARIGYVAVGEGGAEVANQARRDRTAPGGGGPGGPLSGRAAIVTGAAGGLGSATVRALSQAGAAVVPVDVHGDDCLIADVATAEGNRQMVDLALQRHGRLDILVLNAGAQAMSPIADYPETDWDRLMNVMVRPAPAPSRAATFTNPSTACLAAT